MQGVEAAAFAFDRACAAAKVPYAFVGGIAVMAWGQPRATSDVDALLDLLPETTAAFVSAASREGLECDAHDFEDARIDHAHVTMHHPASGFHIDIKLVRHDDERRQIEAAHRLRVADGSVVVPRPEDVVAYKLLYGSPQDIADARSILVRQAGRLDLAHLRDLARRLRVLDAFERLLAEDSS